MQKITITEVENIAVRLAQEMLAFNEPIPDYSTRFPNILESCIATPFQSFDRKSLYPTLIAQASMVFYLMIKNHPFQNGHKRIAMMTLLYFLYKNGKWIKISTIELYNFTMWISQSPAKLNDETVTAIKKFLQMYLVEL
jgi:death-on-curing family protein